ncbi:1822_t:CDS:2, partial [Dentiscutata heterogama]
KELLLQICSIKKTLDTEKYSMIANTQKYNLASFYRKTPEDITEDFVEKYSQKEMRNAYSALVQAVNSLDNLHENYRFMVIGDS